MLCLGKAREVAELGCRDDNPNPHPTPTPNQVRREVVEELGCRDEDLCAAAGTPSCCRPRAVPAPSPAPAASRKVSGLVPTRVTVTTISCGRRSSPDPHDDLRALAPSLTFPGAGSSPNPNPTPRLGLGLARARARARALLLPQAPGRTRARAHTHAPNARAPVRAPPHTPRQAAAATGLSNPD